MGFLDLLARFRNPIRRRNIESQPILVVPARSRKNKRVSEWVIAAATGVQAVTALGGLFILWWQLSLTADQVKLTADQVKLTAAQVKLASDQYKAAETGAKEQSDNLKAQLEQSSKQAMAMQSSADAAFKSLAQSEKFFRYTQRGELITEGVQSFSQDGRPALAVTLRNTGRTSALNVKVAVKANVCVVQECSGLAFHPDAGTLFGELPPGQALKVPVTTDSIPGLVVLPERSKQVADGNPPTGTFLFATSKNRKFAVFGSIEYSDVFVPRERRTQTFCFEYDPALRLFVQTCRPAAVAPLSDWPAEKLVDEARKLAAELKNKSREHTAADRERQTTEWFNDRESSRGMTQQEMSKLMSRRFQEQAERSSRQSEARNSEFDTTYRSRIMQLRDELIARTPPGNAQTSSGDLRVLMMIEAASLAGPEPLIDIANYLLRLADRVPLVQK